MPTTVNYRFQIAGKNAATLTSENPTPLMRELVAELDTAKLKLGDGATAWTSLAYFYPWTKWGRIAGTLSDQTDLQSALNLKAPLASPALTGTPTAPTATPGTNTTQIATTAFVAALVSLATTGLLDLKGDIDCSANPNYPAASKGDAYVVSVAGKVGGASGISVDVGDTIIAKADNAGGTQAAVGSSWWSQEHNLAGALLSANNLSDVASASTARTNLGLGALAVKGTVNDADWSGTDLAITNGGTGASSASAARTNLGLVAVAASGAASDLSNTASGIIASTNQQAVNNELAGMISALQVTPFSLSSALPAGVTMTRASTGMRVNVAGTLVSEAVDAPRFDYNVSSHAARGLLVEAAATNLLLRSAEFDDASWSKNFGTISSTSATAPDGTSTAETFTEDTNNNGHRVSQAVTVTAVPHVLSFYLKQRSRRYALIFNGASGAFFDLQAGTVVGSLGSPTASGIEAAPNGFYRCWLKWTPVAGSRTMEVYASPDGSTFSYTGTSTICFDIWGGQLEIAAAMTSYVPTAGASATRSADAVVVTMSLRAVPDGTITVRYTFDDASTQDVSTSVSSGAFTIPTTLNRPRILSLRKV